MNIVLFAGAGFSAPFGFPVMDGFLAAVRSNSRITGEQRDFIDSLARESALANRIVDISPTNLEGILSIAVMGDRLGIGKERRANIIGAIASIYRTSRPAKSYWEDFDPLKDFLGFDLGGNDHKLKLITTNYDICLESAFARLGQKVNPVLQYEGVRDGEPIVTDTLYDNSGIPLFKMHGSVNWFLKDRRKKKIFVEDRVVHVHSFGENPKPTLPYICMQDYPKHDPPVLIPPSFLKPDLPEAVRAIWAGAAEAISEADILIFIGYSFPTSDTEMKFFFARALDQNFRLSAIHIVDPDADIIEARINSPASGYGSHFKALIRSHGDYWEKTSLLL